MQQAAEKSFKAWLALLGAVYPLIHDEELLEMLAAREPEATRFDALIDYTPLRGPAPLCRVPCRRSTAT